MPAGGCSAWCACCSGCRTDATCLSAYAQRRRSSTWRAWPARWASKNCNQMGCTRRPRAVPSALQTRTTLPLPMQSVAASIQTLKPTLLDLLYSRTRCILCLTPYATSLNMHTHCSTPCSIFTTPDIPDCDPRILHPPTLSVCLLNLVGESICTETERRSRGSSLESSWKVNGRAVRDLRAHETRNSSRMCFPVHVLTVHNTPVRILSDTPRGGGAQL